MLKKIISIILASVLSLALTMHVFATDPDSYADGSTLQIVNGVWETDENGTLTCTVKIPIVWENGVVTRAPSDCDVTFAYHKNGVFSYYIAFKSFGLIKSMQGTVSTYGVAGSTSRAFYEESFFVPLAQLSHSGEFRYLHPTTSGKQFLKVVGIVDGVNASGSFGPTTISINISPDN